MKLKFYIDVEAWHGENYFPAPLPIPGQKSSTAKRYEITADIPEDFKQVDIKVVGEVREVSEEVIK